MRRKPLVFLFVLLLLAGLTMACTETTEPERVDPNDVEAEVDIDETDEEMPVAPEVFSVGESVKMGELQFTVNSAHWDTGDEYWGPDEGERWIVIDCTMENTGTESEAMSSLMMFKLMDEEGYSRDLEIGADTKGSLDGELAAGSMMRGQLAYSVDEGQERWELIFEPNLFGFGQARYEITAADVQ